MHGTTWRESAYHRAWLTGQAMKLLNLFEANAVNPRGRFFELGDEGQPLIDRPNSNVRIIHVTTRMVYCFALAHLLGHPGALALVEHGIAYIDSAHRDRANGGFFWSVNDDGAVDSGKQGYGHAFVLLAAASAKAIGLRAADPLLTEIVDLIVSRFWEKEHGAAAEEFSAEWQPLDDYRGQNSNMHLTEALMAGFEVGGDRRLLEMAESIAELLIHKAARAHGWRLPEHFDSAWRVNRDYAASEMFRPAGTTPGHWLEWSRLLVQLWLLGDRRHDWMAEAATALFRTAIEDGWDAQRGGFYYTLDFGGRPLNSDKIWWPVCEGIAAAATIAGIDTDPFYETWYRRLWDFAAVHFIDRHDGGWRPQLDVDLRRKTTLFTGKPDIYHSLQSLLIPLSPDGRGLLAAFGGTPAGH